MAASHAIPPDQLGPQRRMLILAICCMSLLIVSLDITIVNVALPRIAHELHSSIRCKFYGTVDATE